MNTICRIFTCEKKGQPLLELSEIEAIEGCGLKGDRWYRSNDPLTTALRWVKARKRGEPLISTNISIITTAQIAAGNAFLDETFTAEQMRRNIVIDGDIDLNLFAPEPCCALDFEHDGFCKVHTTGGKPGREFMIGSVRFRGSGWCAPCTIPPGRAGKLKGKEQQFKTAFEVCGGLRAQIMNSGVLRMGDAFTCHPELLELCHHV